MELHTLSHHPVHIVPYSWIYLAGNKSVLVIARLKNGHIGLSAPLHDLLVGLPKDHLGIRAAIPFNPIVNPLGPIIRVVLDGLVRQGRIRGDAPKNIVLGFIILTI